MRKILFLIAILPSIFYAAPVDPALAQQIAENFINASNQSTDSVVQRAPRRLKRMARQSASEDGNQYYIFNSTDGEGFVIVAANDVATPILGYSKEGSIDLDNLPIQLQDLLNAYSEEINSAVDNHLQATDSVRLLWENFQNAPQSRTAVAVVNALISTQWDQYPRYNNKCPSDASLSYFGGHPTTGCVATAMAQIMKYWEYPKKGSGNKTYNSQRYGSLSANFAITEYDWANMPLKLTSSTSATQNDAVATLMYHCGVAVEMEYNQKGDGSSGAYAIDYGYGGASAEKALKTYFGYANSIIGKQSRLMTSTAWTNMLKTELDNQRPILYAGRNPNGGGHAFICDGYDSSDRFHFNWGWGGSANGFYSLTALTPSSENFSDNQQAVIGIKPVDGSGPAKNYDLYMNTNLTATGTTGSSSTTNLYNYGNTLSFTAKIENNGTGIFNGNFKVGVFTNDGEFIAWSKESYHFSLSAGATTVLKTYTFDGGIPFVPGTYRAWMYYQDDNESNCNLVKSDEGIWFTEYNNVAFTVKIADDLQIASDFELDELFGGYTTGSKVRISVDVNNIALRTTFYGRIRLALYNLDGSLAEIIDEIDYSSGISPLTTKTLSYLTIIGVEPGTYYLALTYQKTNQTSWYFAGSNSRYFNFVKVIITAPSLVADDYEENNTQATVTTLNWEIDPEIIDFSTGLVSLHEDTDIDYYKLSFPLPNRYNINVYLCDKYNQCGMHYTNADAQFEYSVGGHNYYGYYKNNYMISILGPTTVYIRVRPFGMAGLGYYELSGDIEEIIDSAVDDINVDNSTVSKKLIDGQIHVFRNNCTYDILGRKVN